MLAWRHWGPLCRSGIASRPCGSMSNAAGRRSTMSRTTHCSRWWSVCAPIAPALQQRHTRLRPETALAAAWGRDVFADQSTISRTLDAFTPVTVAQLRTAVERIYVREGRALHHPFDQELLFLDIDLTGLPAGRHAEASTKGYFSGKKTVAGVSSPG